MLPVLPSLANISVADEHPFETAQSLQNANLAQQIANMHGQQANQMQPQMLQAQLQNMQTKTGYLQQQSDNYPKMIAAKMQAIQNASPQNKGAAGQAVWSENVLANPSNYTQAVVAAAQQVHDKQQAIIKNTQSKTAVMGYNPAMKSAYVVHNQYPGKTPFATKMQNLAAQGAMSTAQQVSAQRYNMLNAAMNQAQGLLPSAMKYADNPTALAEDEYRNITQHVPLIGGTPPSQSYYDYQNLKKINDQIGAEAQKAAQAGTSREEAAKFNNIYSLTNSPWADSSTAIRNRFNTLRILFNDLSSASRKPVGKTQAPGKLIPTPASTATTATPNLSRRDKIGLLLKKKFGVDPDAQ
jgi:hypothetical protein